MSTEIISQNKVIEAIKSKRFSYTLWRKVDDIPACWDELVAYHDLFLSKAYLSGLEKATPKGMKHYFVGFYNENKLIGVALFQTTHIKTSKSYRFKFSTKKGFSFVERLVKTSILKLFNLKIFVAGNLMLTGEHSYYFNSISEKEAFEIWYRAINDFKKTVFKPNVTLLKDFFEYKKYDFEIIENDQNHLFYVEPNMILHLNSEWNTLADYTAAMRKKYRARVRVARKKFNGIKRKVLSYSEIIAHHEAIFKLYKSVSKNASFNTFTLSENYFEEMKRSLKDKFRLTAYFLEDEMVGFFTVILDAKKVETHFLGYCPERNKEYQLYLNMLYDMAEIGIYENKEAIIYARTALEIKSSVGAVPYDMKGFMKHENPIINKIAFPIFNFLKPKNHWIQRHPFKKA